MLSTALVVRAAFRRASGRFPDERGGWGKSPDRPDLLAELDLEAAGRVAATRLGCAVLPPALLVEVATFCGQFDAVYTPNDQ